MISKCRPLSAEICYRALKFVRKCDEHSSALARFVASHSITSIRGFSVLGSNVSFCMHRYNVSFFEILNGRLSGIIHTCIQNRYDTSMAASANLLAEALQLRDGLLTLPIDQSLSLEDICDIINFVCVT